MIFKLFNQIPVTSMQLNHILESIQFEYDNLSLYQTNARITDFLLDDTQILRLSRNKMPEVENQNKVHHILGVPNIYTTGIFELENQTLHYAVTNFIPGETLYDAIDKDHGARPHGLF